MRYTDNVIFIKAQKSHYSPDLGEWTEQEPLKIDVLCNVTDLGTTRSKELFGDIKQEAKVIRTMPLFNWIEFDYVEIDGKKYEEITNRKPLERNSLIVQEVNYE